ncbi:MAG: response regulator transcription factor, partial [Acidobacteria bacterium]|nr:response regulator transcription factor [Acidobacteriota bacterium]
FSMAELEARIRVVVRHRPPEADAAVSSTIDRGELHLDLVHHEVRLAHEALTLTSKEFDVLAFLARHARRTCTHQMILGAVWGSGYAHEAQYVHAYVHRLRQKLHDDDGELIVSVPGVGYVLMLAEE